MSISLFIPVYNEEKILKRHINKIYDYLKKITDKFELVIVDDSSTDNTHSIILELQKQKEFLRYLRFENGPSRRENLGESMKTAKYSLVGYMDFDLAVPMFFLKELIKSANEGYDLAIGSRRIKGAKVNRSFYRRVWSALYHKTIKLLFLSNIHDYQCGFKLFKKESLITLLEEVGYDKKFQRGWFWDAQLILSAEKRGFKIKEIPISWNEGAKSSFSLSRELKVLPYIFKLKLRF